MANSTMVTVGGGGVGGVGGVGGSLSVRGMQAVSINKSMMRGVAVRSCCCCCSDVVVVLDVLVVVVVVVDVVVVLDVVVVIVVSSDPLKREISQKKLWISDSADLDSKTSIVFVIVQFPPEQEEIEMKFVPL